MLSKNESSTVVVDTLDMVRILRLELDKEHKCNDRVIAEAMSLTCALKMKDEANERLVTALRDLEDKYLDVYNRLHSVLKRLHPQAEKDLLDAFGPILGDMRDHMKAAQKSAQEVKA